MNEKLTNKVPVYSFYIKINRNMETKIDNIKCMDSHSCPISNGVLFFSPIIVSTIHKSVISSIYNKIVSINPPNHSIPL